MYGKIAGGGGLIGAALPVTGIDVLYTLLIAFTLIGAGFAVTRCIPHAAHVLTAGPARRLAGLLVQPTRGAGAGAEAADVGVRSPGAGAGTSAPPWSRRNGG
jgi:hypothetical protein